ncbi:MAG: hypothetical protein U0414_11715 [Polyangiaceae bacterium]
MRRILVTSSRMPAAIDEIRKLGRAGHAILSADTFAGAPGAHSRYVERALTVASPRYEPRAFVEDVKAIIEEQAIDLVVPCFEEALYLARVRDELPKRARYAFAEFEVLEVLHDKHRLTEVARALGVRAPEGIVVRSSEELAWAAHQFTDYFAKPVYSRGGVTAQTNKGPLAGARDPSMVTPTDVDPWIVEEYVEGEDVCSFSVASRGRVTAHVTYVHPRQIENAGGMVFESIDCPESLEITRRFVEWSSYEGQIAFDFRRSARGLHVIECNPRPTAGVHLMPGKTFVDALLSPRAGAPVVIPAGVRAKYSLGLLRDMALHPSEAREDWRYLLSDAADPIVDPDDLMPALWQVLSSGITRTYRRRHGYARKRSTDLMAAYFDDICWNGEQSALLREQPASAPSPWDPERTDTVWHAAALAVAAAVAAAASAEERSDAEVTRRLAFIEARLDAATPAADRWSYGWFTAYTTLTVAQAGVALGTTDPGLRADMTVGAFSSAFGVLPFAVLPFKPRFAAAELSVLPARTPKERARKLGRAERLLEDAADAEAFGHGWMMQVGVLTVNVGIGLGLALGYDRIRSGVSTTLIGIAVSEFQIFTQPTAAMEDWDAYRRGDLGAAAPSPAAELRLSPIPGGLAIGASF